jgi:Ca-activated chloride channel homolog
MAGFHFLRPEWFLALLPATILSGLLYRRLRLGGNDWAREIDSHLLAHLALPGRRTGGQWPAALLFAGWIAAVFAMAGPTWEKVQQPVTGRPEGVVIAVNLSQSMNARDVSPSRLVAARHKIADILKKMGSREVALVLYSDISFAATPLTQDAQVVAQMLPDLSTELMPATTNHPQDAIAMAVRLLKGTGARSGRILLVTDGPGDEPGKTLAAAEAAATAGYKVNVIGVGAGGANGAPAVDPAALAAIASGGDGAYTPLTADDRDIATVLPPVTPSHGAVTDSEGFTSDEWADMGPFVLLIAVLLAPLAFRRGWIAVVAVAALGGLATPDRAEAQSLFQDLRQSWADAWWRPDQQAASDFAKGDYAAAAQKFEDPAWKANALYKAGDYSAAATALSRLPGGAYNQGNALARAGQIEEAVAAYDKALAANPDDADARFNRDLVQKLIDARKKREEEEEKKKQDQAGGGGGGGDGGQDQKSGSRPPPPAGQKSGGNPPQDAQTAPQPAPLSPPAPLPPRRPTELAQQEQPQSPPPKEEAPQTPPPDSPPPPASSQDAPKAKTMTVTGLPAIPVNPTAPPPPFLDNEQDAPATKPDRNAEFNAPPAGPSHVDRVGQARRRAAPPPRVSISDDDQSRDQALRLVPDDPGRLLRARIKAQYEGSPLFLPEGNTQ